VTTDGRFDPPAARVADVGAAPAWGRGFAIVLGLLVMLQVAWAIPTLALVLSFVDGGMLSPLGLVLATAGELCLVAGVLRMVRRGDQGGRLFLAALVLLVLNRLAWRAGWFVVLVPHVLGMLIAAGGVLVAWQRRRAMSRQAAQGEAA
jgi:hypothetical protein